MPDTQEQLSEEELEARAKKQKRAKVRIAIGAGLVVASLGAWLFTRYGVHKAGLGGDCLYAMNCSKEAPTCLRVLDEKGACSRPCELGADCAPEIRCVKVGLGEYDDRGVPLEGGYCIPQALLDARKRARTDGGAGGNVAETIDSLLRVPAASNQLEAEVTFRAEKNGTPTGEPRSFLVKGTLARPSPGASAKKRTIVDADALRLFSIDDERHTFVVTPLGGGARTDVTVTKTGRTDQVLGRDCEIWKLEEARATHEACVVLGGAFVDPAARVAPGWSRELAVRSAFPLRVIELDSIGRELSRLVAVRFDAHPVDASLFAVPRDYTNLAGR